MRTTINELVGRRGDAHSGRTRNEILQDVLALLADTRALLKIEVDQQFRTEVDSVKDPKVNDVKNVVLQINKALQQIDDLEAKFGLKQNPQGVVLDLEAARDEILGRLSRLAT